MRTAVLSLFLALILIIPFSQKSSAWDYLENLLLPNDIAERPPQVSYSEDFDDLIFTRENFYNKSAGTRQYRRTIRAPQKNMKFKALNPIDEEPSPEAKIVEKDGKPVTVISIGKEPESGSESD